MTIQTLVHHHSHRRQALPAWLAEALILLLKVAIAVWF